VDAGDKMILRLKRPLADVHAHLAEETRHWKPLSGSLCFLPLNELFYSRMTWRISDAVRPVRDSLKIFPIRTERIE